MREDSSIYLNAENPESLSIAVADEQQTLKIEGSSSRPMKLSFKWENLSACLFDGLPSTTFCLNGADEPILAHEARAVKGLTLDVTKVFVPTSDASEHCRYDKFRIPIIEDEPVNKLTESSANETEAEEDLEAEVPNV
jgi:hypothetical protein